MCPIIITLSLVVCATHEEELVGNMIKSGSLGCMTTKKFKILKGWRKESSRVQILDLRQILAVHVRTEGSQIQEKITVTQWAWFVSIHKMSYVTRQGSRMLKHVTVLALIHSGQDVKLHFLLARFLKLQHLNKIVFSLCLSCQNCLGLLSKKKKKKKRERRKEKNSPFLLSPK